MALIKQDAAKPRDASSLQISSGPDYVAEAEEARLKLRGDELLRDSSRLAPQRTMGTRSMIGRARAAIFGPSGGANPFRSLAPARGLVG